MGIPVKVNMIPEGSRTVFRNEGEQQSERSDAGVVIVKESVRNGQARTSGAKRRSSWSRDWGCRGKGQPPLCPCSINIEATTHAAHSSFSSEGALGFFLMESPRISMRCAL